MLKVIGMILIFLGTAAYGQVLNIRINSRYQELIHMKEFLLLLQNEMVHFRLELPQAFQRLSDKVESPYTEVCIDMSDRLNQCRYAYPSKAWRETIDDNRNAFFAGPEEMQFLYQAGVALDQNNSSMQAEEIGMVTEQIAAKIVVQRVENISKRKISRYLSISVGMLLIIILI